jgi:hypothetical protein
MSIAWHVAALSRQKRLPSLRSLMIRKAKEKPPTMAQQRAVLTILSAQMGIPLRKRVTHG